MIYFQTLNTKKTLSPDAMVVICKNMAAYMEHLPLEVGPVQPGSPWLTLLAQMELFFRRIVLLLPTMDDVLAPITVMSSIFKFPGISSCKVRQLKVQNDGNFNTSFMVIIRLTYLCSYLGNFGSVLKNSQLCYPEHCAGVEHGGGAVPTMWPCLYARQREAHVDSYAYFRIGSSSEIQDNDAGREFHYVNQFRHPGKLFPSLF